MGAEVVLAVDISTTPEGSQAESMLQILLQIQLEMWLLLLLLKE
jgi:hypothetical protein